MSKPKASLSSEVSKMPWFKVWSSNRQVRKVVKAESLDELKEKGMSMLCNFHATTAFSFDMLVLVT